MLNLEKRDDRIDTSNTGVRRIFRSRIKKCKKIAKRTIRDSIFARLFRDKENVLRLYKRLHPDDKNVDIEDVDIVTLETVLVDGMYNDLGFSIKDKTGKVRKIVLVEAQTKWDKNMAERMSKYAQMTREEFWKKSCQIYHQKKKMYTPFFEHYLIYTGDRDCEDYIKLHNFDLPENSMNLGIEVITEVDDTICGQYIGFCKVYSDRIRNNKKDKNKVLSETIRICREKNYLKEFLDNNIGEVVDSMGKFYNQALAIEDYGEERRKVGEKIGIEVGEKIGREAGERIGREAGERIGREAGEKIGREAGEKIGREEAAAGLMRTFFAKDKRKMELFAKNMGMTMIEYIDACAQNMKISKEAFIRICAENIGMTVKEYKKEYGIE